MRDPLPDACARMTDGADEATDEATAEEVPGAVEEVPADATCRICFESTSDAPDDPLVAPCACSGSQKYVHVLCLRKWQAHQRLTAASAREADGGRKRVLRCDVCHAPIDTRLARPPTDAELVETVRPDDGRAIAACLGAGVLLVSAKVDPPPAVNMPGAMGMFLRRRAGHWIGHVFLLHASESGGANDGSDCLLGVNLTRAVQLDDELTRCVGAAPHEIVPPDALGEIVQCATALQKQIRAARRAGVDVRHCIGGPCSSKEILCVHAESGVAGSQAALPSGEVCYGGAVPDVLSAATARASERPVVFLCFGHARWGRAQLMNEVLRGDWGVRAGDGVDRALIMGAGLTHAAMKQDEGTRWITPVPQS